MTKNKLNNNQEMFCQQYAGGGENFGNAVWAYIFAYKTDVPFIAYSKLNEQQKKDYDTTCINAAILIRNHKIQKRCNELLDALIKDEIVDRELAKVIMQNNELSAKVSAIKEYNAVRKRTEANKVEIKIEVSANELKDYIALRKSKEK